MSPTFTYILTIIRGLVSRSGTLSPKRNIEKERRNMRKRVNNNEA